LEDFPLSKIISRSAVAVLALTVGMTGIAQAESTNIWSASRHADVSSPSIEQVQYRRHYRHHDGISPGAAAAIGIGAVAVGAAIASQSNRRYYEDRYYDGGGYYEGRSSYVEPRSGYCDSNRPKHYPAPAGC
jgi:hypothetical protein